SRTGGAGLFDLYASTRQLPVVRARDLTVEAGDSCQATLNAADLDDGSFDPAGGGLQFSFDPAAAGPFGLGTHTVRLIATDDHGVTNSAIASLTVGDQTPPAITGAGVDKETLWPPDHQMVDVTVSYLASDNCGIATVGLSVSSNESNDNGESDWEIIDEHHVRLRAERNGNGDGRIYSITITAVDSHGNISTQIVTVNVPHDRRGQN